MRVLMATDGSDSSKAAVEWLRDFPVPPTAEITVLNVALVPPSSIQIPQVEEFRDAARASARTIADEAATMLRARWPAVTVRVVDATAHADVREPILQACEDVDLVVVGARGLGAVKGFLLGSVSTAVVRHAPCNVLVTKGAPRPVRRAVIGVDGSEGAGHAIGFVAGLGPGLRAVSVTLLGVVEEMRYPSTAPGRVSRELRAALKELHQERRIEMEGVVASAGTPLKPEVAALDVVVEVGPPAQVLVEAANRPECDLVVVGARGLGAIQRLVLGSVSERVLREARCPVLIVKPASPR